MSRPLQRAAIAVLALLGASCIGSIDRAEFDEEVRRRGGGISNVWIDESLDAAAAELALDTDEVELLALTIDTGERSLTITARRGDRPEFVDSITVRQGDVVGVSPLQDADDLPLDDLTVPLARVPVDRFEELADRAIADFDEVDGYVTTITVASPAGDPTVTMTLDSARRTGRAVFAADGTLIEVTS